MSEKSCSSTCTSKDCKNCAKNNNNIQPEFHPDKNIKHVIAIASGKGGVGKSTVTALIARKLAKAGYRVGILDGDITGPSIPKMFGIYSGIEVTEKGMEPATSAEGIKIISMNLLLDNEEDPVLFRGPILGQAIMQFWNDVNWGELDYLLIDMPPGTGDVPLTVYQSIPIDGVVIVTSPQQLVKMIVMKAYNMAEKMNVPVLGLVENYSYFKCPDCNKEYKIFGESNIDELAYELATKVLSKLPITPELAAGADMGAFDCDLIEFDLEELL